MSEPKRMDNEQFLALLKMTGRDVERLIKAEARRSRAREKRLEEMALALVSSVLDGDRWWTMRRKDVEVDAKNLRAALSEET